MVQQSLLWCRLAALLAPLLGANYLPKKHEKDTFNHICTIFYFCAQQALASLLRSPSDHIFIRPKYFCGSSSSAQALQLKLFGSSSAAQVLQSAILYHINVMGRFTHTRCARLPRHEGGKLCFPVLGRSRFLGRCLRGVRGKGETYLARSTSCRAGNCYDAELARVCVRGFVKSRKTFRTSLSQRGAKVFLDLKKCVT